MKGTIQMIAILTWCFYTKYVIATVKYPDIVQRYNQFIEFDGTDLYGMFMSISNMDHKSEK